MKSIEGILLCTFCTIISLTSSSSFGQQKSIIQLQSELVSPWIVTVEGEARTRTLRITGGAQKPDGSLLLEAVYGWTDGNQTPISATASQSSQQSTLQFSTQSNSRIVATQTALGIFEGAFTDKNEQTKPIRIQKVSEAELQLKISAAKSARASAIITKPPADVPATCAAFSGRWTGTWGYGIGQQWLWLASIDAKCTAKVAYLATNGMPTGYKTIEIKDGKLSVVCGGSDTCTFNVVGEELYAVAYGITGSNNNAVFKKLPD